MSDRTDFTGPDVPRRLTPDEVTALIRRAHAEQAAAIRAAILRLFRHRPAAAVPARPVSAPAVSPVPANPRTVTAR